MQPQPTPPQSPPTGQYLSPRYSSRRTSASNGRTSPTAPNTQAPTAPSSNQSSSGSKPSGSPVAPSQNSTGPTPPPLASGSNPSSSTSSASATRSPNPNGPSTQAPMAPSSASASSSASATAPTPPATVGSSATGSAAGSSQPQAATGTPGTGSASGTAANEGLGIMELSDAPGTSDGYIINRSLPHCRRSRMVDPAVIMNPHIPLLRDSPANQRPKLLIQKVRLCSFVFNSVQKPEPGYMRATKEVKRGVLLELFAFFQFKPSLTDEQMGEIIEMIRLNLFRPFPTKGDGDDDQRSERERPWTVNQIIYECLLLLANLTETDSRILEKHFSHSFVLGLLELFDSEDARERDYLKTVLHRIYGNFMSLRPFIRRSINNVFYKLIYETGKHHGVSELLEILGSIINGFALPLKEQHKLFLSRVLLPLHKVDHLADFHTQLMYCVTQFLEKDISLGPRIISALLRYWPVTNHKKEVLFLTEIDEILSIMYMKPDLLYEIVTPLFQKISNCISSPHHAVAERALCLLNKDPAMKIVEMYHKQITPLLSVPLYSNTHLVAVEVERIIYENSTWEPGASTRPHGHWHSMIVDLTSETLKLFTQIDGPFMASCKDSFDARIVENLIYARKKKQIWDAVEEKIFQKSSPDVRTLLLSEKQAAAQCIDNLQKKMNHLPPEPLN